MHANQAAASGLFDYPAPMMSAQSRRAMRVESRHHRNRAAVAKATKTRRTPNASNENGIAEPSRKRTHIIKEKQSGNDNAHCPSNRTRCAASLPTRCMPHGKDIHRSRRTAHNNEQVVRNGPKCFEDVGHQSCPTSSKHNIRATLCMSTIFSDLVDAGNARKSSK